MLPHMSGIEIVMMGHVLVSTLNFEGAREGAVEETVLNGDIVDTAAFIVTEVWLSLYS